METQIIIIIIIKPLESATLKGETKTPKHLLSLIHIKPAKTKTKTDKRRIKK